ncbi:hypothetical protein [Aeoliella sp.]|uniref:hypothetical protein n=1 Tax=Aeoliella sp. TaxID=2795800 RepID=UPI003CCBB7F0
MRRNHCGRFFLCTLVAAAVGSATEAVALDINFQVTVNPIQVCDNNGFNCGNPDLELYLAETDKIWRQAGIDIKFLDWKLMLNSDLVNNANIGPLRSADNNQELGGDIINMWFVNTIEGGSYGRAGSGDTVIANSVFSFSGGNGRRDTISHEIGHVLGLPHISGVVPLNLMEEGGDRDAVTNISQIFPDGQQRGQLTAAQIDDVLDSFRVNSLEFSIPGDATLDGQVNELDIDAFIAGWRHQQQDPDLESWQKGDFNHDGLTDLHDAYILRQGLIGNAAALDRLSFAVEVPEPTSGVLALAVAGLVWFLPRTTRR